MFRPVQNAQLSINNLQDEMSRLLERIWHGGVSMGPFDGQVWGPAVDTYEFEDHFLVYIELPGVDSESVELSYLNGGLTIRGDKNPPTDAGEADRTLHRERRFGTFCRTLELPGDVQAQDISAKYHAGVLEVTVKKLESQRPKAIKIDVQEA